MNSQICFNSKVGSTYSLIFGGRPNSLLPIDSGLYSGQNFQSQSYVKKSPGAYVKTAKSSFSRTIFRFPEQFCQGPMLRR